MKNLVSEALKLRSSEALRLILNEVKRDNNHLRPIAQTELSPSNKLAIQPEMVDLQR